MLPQPGNERVPGGVDGREKSYTEKEGKEAFQARSLGIKNKKSYQTMCHLPRCYVPDTKLTALIVDGLLNPFQSL